MKKTIPDNPAEAVRLEQLPGIGSAMAADLRRLGIQQPSQLTGQDAYALYDRLCNISGGRQDPCVIDVFLGAIHYMNSGEALPWWQFTAERKKTPGYG
jgi:hypothetical protein